MIKGDTYKKIELIYPLLIQQFVDDYQLETGVALDIGTGPGFLGVELAKITNMDIHFVDINKDALDKAKNYFDSSNVDNKGLFIESSVENLDFADDFTDFIMSRGSIWFWENKEKGLKEIYRVLKPGGVAIIGGGLGRYMPITMRNRIQGIMKEGLERRGEKRPDFQEFKEIVKKAELPNYKIFDDGVKGSGKWIEIRK